ncbi:hypothetical protein [Saccharopolyspora sp. SCSIO 74807]|uniref:hypothetical protein n=1 Tax=Saccharopolyspora sp. SCSIO 74807 TaxID=3118084 RepID=UPI0030CB2A54
MKAREEATRLWRRLGRTLGGRAPDDQQPADEPGPAQREQVPSARTIDGSAVRKVIIACDAGMGSSALVAAQLSEQLGPHRVAVVHASVGDLPADADLVLCQETLLERVRREDIGGAVLLGFRSFLGDPVFDEVAQAVRDGGRLGG